MSKFAERLKATKPKSIDATQELVRVQELEEGVLLPLLVTPAVPNVDVAEWVKSNPEWVEEKLLKHGGILFRGFDLRSQDEFNDFVEKNCKQQLQYKEGATPRTKIANSVYTSTEFPSDQHIALHNELSYVTVWPKRIWFYSLIPAEEGGETPIADVRRVFNRIDPAIRRKFIEKGWMLVRNYGDGFGAPWQYVFRTEDKAEVEEYCRTHEMEWEWKDGDRLRTRQVRPAVTKHPDTGEDLWFNHIAFWHQSSLDAKVSELFLEDFGPEGLPYNTFYGDGEPIPDEVVQALRDAYDQETIAFPWEAGDLLMLDNMLVAHGRSPFKGARKTLVSMGEPYSRS